MNHWYSRDVQAIAAARGLTHVAPYFIDTEAAGPSGALSVASMPGDQSAAEGIPRSAGGATRGVASAASGTSAERAPPAAGAVVPIGGLTVITFHNSHLVYAITWYTLALMVAGAIWLGVRSETRA
jgi:surfeit locus 1 family protein